MIGKVEREVVLGLICCGKMAVNGFGNKRRGDWKKRRFILLNETRISTTRLIVGRAPVDRIFGVVA